MRKTIFEYIEPSSSEKEALWHDCIFVFDANVLLNLYRYSSKTKNTLLYALEDLQTKLWLPQQVAYEFAKNRSSVIFETCSKYGSLENKISSFVKECQDTLRLNDSDNEIVSLKDMLSKWLKEREESNLMVSNPLEDKILDKLLELYDGKVGQPYTQEALTAIKEEGKKRYEQSVPPGYKDVGKKSACLDNNCYGDFIVWKQIISYASTNKKSIIYVTHDQKEDWWNIVSGKTIGPRIELRKEFVQDTGRKFHMYSMDGFIRHFSEISGIPTDQTVIDEVAFIDNLHEYKAEDHYLAVIDDAPILVRDMLILQRKIEKQRSSIKQIEANYADKYKPDKINTLLSNTEAAMEKSKRKLRAKQAEYNRLISHHT